MDNELKIFDEEEEKEKHPKEPDREVKYHWPLEPEPVIKTWRDSVRYRFWLWFYFGGFLVCVVWFGWNMATMQNIWALFSLFLAASFVALWNREDINLNGGS